MKLDEKTMQYWEDACTFYDRKFASSLSKEDKEDLRQDTLVAIMESRADTTKNLKGQIQFVALTVYGGWVRKEHNRRRLETENAELIVKNTTPTLSVPYAGGPEDFVASEQELVRRWESLSPLLRRVARRTFFGYMESPEKTARELGMTVAAVNMARTRIKQHMNGVNDD